MMDLQDHLKGAALGEALVVSPSLSSVRTACTLKGGVPEHRDSGLLLALQPSPSGLDHGIVTWHTSDGRDLLEGRDPRT